MANTAGVSAVLGNVLCMVAGSRRGSVAAIAADAAYIAPENIGFIDRCS
jgi:hypothetical protein